MNEKAINLLLQVVETEEARCLLFDALEGKYHPWKDAYNSKPFLGGPFYRGSGHATLTLLYRHAVMGNDISRFERSIERLSKRRKIKAVIGYIPQPSPLK